MYEIETSVVGRASEGNGSSPMPHSVSFEQKSICPFSDGPPFSFGAASWVECGRILTFGREGSSISIRVLGSWMSWLLFVLITSTIGFLLYFVALWIFYSCSIEIDFMRATSTCM